MLARQAGLVELGTEVPKVMTTVSLSCAITGRRIKDPVLLPGLTGGLHSICRNNYAEKFAAAESSGADADWVLQLGDQSFNMRGHAPATLQVDHHVLALLKCTPAAQQDIFVLNEPILAPLATALQEKLKALQDGGEERTDAEAEAQRRQQDSENAVATLMCFDTETEALDHVPKDCICPITQELMTDPVITADGHSYERAAIQRWFSAKQTSPRTNCRVEHMNLLANLTLRSLCTHWREIVQRSQQREAAAAEGRDGRSAGTNAGSSSGGGGGGGGDDGGEDSENLNVASTPYVQKWPQFVAKTDGCQWLQVCTLDRRMS